MLRNRMPHLTKGCANGGQSAFGFDDRFGVIRAHCVCGRCRIESCDRIFDGSLRCREGVFSLGTSDVILASSGVYKTNAVSAVKTFCHAVPDSWYHMSAMLSATDGLNWLSRITGYNPANLTSSLDEDLKAPSKVRFFAISSWRAYAQ